MPKKQLEWSIRAGLDLIRIVDFYEVEASRLIADEALSSFEKAALAIAANPLHYREGKKPGTREYIMRRFPYTLIYRLKGQSVIIVRVLHQAGKFFN